MIKVGVGMSTVKELVVKAGRKDVGINSKVWIGEAVTKASNLSSLGNKSNLPILVYSDCSYTNFINYLEKWEINPRSWFAKHSSTEYGTYYTANIVDYDFDNWITDGMNG